MIEIVPADASRVDELEPLWLALREHHGSVTGHWGPLRPAEDSWARRRQNYADILAEGGWVFLAVEGDAVLGCAVCEREAGGSPTWEWPQDFVAVVDLVVAPGARGRGAGERLIGAVEADARARGVAAIALSVAAPNTLARRFYERHGFRADLVEYRKPLR
jgi:ribosomal protein S18 acetylase RimI-like enzyme